MECGSARLFERTHNQDQVAIEHAADLFPYTTVPVELLIDAAIANIFPDRRDVVLQVLTLNTGNGLDDFGEAIE